MKWQPQLAFLKERKIPANWLNNRQSPSPKSTEEWQLGLRMESKDISWPTWSPTSVTSASNIRLLPSRSKHPALGHRLALSARMSDKEFWMLRLSLAWKKRTCSLPSESPSCMKLEQPSTSISRSSTIASQTTWCATSTKRLSTHQEKRQWSMEALFRITMELANWERGSWRNPSPTSRYKTQCTEALRKLLIQTTCLRSTTLSLEARKRGTRISTTKWRCLRNEWT